MSAISDKYALLGGAKGILGNVVEFEKTAADGVGAFFNKGGGYLCLPMPNWDDLIDAAPAWPAWDLFPNLGIPAFS